MSYTSLQFFGMEAPILLALPFSVPEGGRKKRNGDKIASVLTLVLSLSEIQFKNI
jgi:hypothetical protein